MKAEKARKTITPRTKPARTTRGGFACSELVDEWERRISEAKAAVEAEATAVYRARCELERVRGNLADAKRRLAETKREYRVIYN